MNETKLPTTPHATPSSAPLSCFESSTVGQSSILTAPCPLTLTTRLRMAAFTCRHIVADSIARADTLGPHSRNSIVPWQGKIQGSNPFPLSCRTCFHNLPECRQRSSQKQAERKREEQALHDVHFSIGVSVWSSCSCRVTAGCPRRIHVLHCVSVCFQDDGTEVPRVRMQT
jgi:hypothetical protein